VHNPIRATKLHINLTGTYAWGEKPSLVDGFRPLRLPQPLARAA